MCDAIIGLAPEWSVVERELCSRSNFGMFRGKQIVVFFSTRGRIAHFC